ncbi:MAG TPA: hypothetical protein VIX37_22805, partial [Candidatus Sulfotelmatobacter sp.]
SELKVHPDAVRNAIESERFQGAQPLRGSLVDPYLGFVRQTLEQHPRLLATRIYAMIRDRGYSGSIAFGPKTQRVPAAATFGIERRLQSAPTRRISGLLRFRSTQLGPFISDISERPEEARARPVFVLRPRGCLDTNWRTCDPVTMIDVSRGVYGSGRVAVVGVQHAAQAPPPLDLSCATEVARFWADELVPQALMIALAVIQVSNRTPILAICATYAIHGIPGMIAR